MGKLKHLRKSYQFWVVVTAGKWQVRKSYHKVEDIEDDHHQNNGLLNVTTNFQNMLSWMLIRNVELLLLILFTRMENIGPAASPRSKHVSLLLGFSLSLSLSLSLSIWLISTFLLVQELMEFFADWRLCGCHWI